MIKGMLAVVSTLLQGTTVATDSCREQAMLCTLLLALGDLALVRCLHAAALGCTGRDGHIVRLCVRQGPLLSAC